MKTFVQYLFLVLFIVAQLYFVGAIVLNKNTDGSILGLFGILTVLLAISYYRQKKWHIKTSSKIPYHVIPVFLLGTFFTVLLKDFLNLNSVLSAGIVGFLGSFFPKLNWKNTHMWPAAIYCGAFVGMTHTDLGYLHLILAGLFSSLFYVFTQNWFNGIGGKLGTVAFMGVLYSYIIYKFIIL